jgi:hypothetical protein
MLIKFDFFKAHDRLNWDFMTQMIKAFGFNNKCITLVINGLHILLLKGSKGIQQEDPSFLLMITTA